MSRLMTLLLLYKSGFTVGKYISIEKEIEKTKETYYEVLEQSDTLCQRRSSRLIKSQRSVLITGLLGKNRYVKTTGHLFGDDRWF